MNKIKKWAHRNIVAIAFVLIFIFIYILSLDVENTFLYYGATGIQYLHGEYYRWLTCLFLHYNLRHLLANSAALLAASSLLSPFLKKWQTILLFLSGGILSEIAFSVVVTENSYDIGASSGIFTLIACLLVYYLRYQYQFQLTWYRPDVIIVLVYFVFANTSIPAFLVHTFGFVAGILISFVLVERKTGINDKRRP